MSFICKIYGQTIIRHGDLPEIIKYNLYVEKQQLLKLIYIYITSINLTFMNKF